MLPREKKTKVRYKPRKVRNGLETKFENRMGKVFEHVTVWSGVAEIFLGWYFYSKILVQI